MEQPQKRCVLPAWNAETYDAIEEEGPPPGAKPGNAVVRVQATSVQSTDLLQRLGKYPRKYFKETPPCTLGYDFIGKVVNISDETSETSAIKVGDIVADLCRARAHARYIEVEADHLVKVPEGVIPEQGTTLILSWMTAYHMLYTTPGRSKVEAGGKIFVAGGAGAVAQAVIVFAKMAGCEVYTTAQEKNHEFIRSLGGIPFDYKNPNWVSEMKQAVGKAGVDMALDGVVSDGLKSTTSILGSRGHLVLYGVQDMLKKGKFLPGLSAVKLLARAIPYSIKPGSSFTFFDISASKGKNLSRFKQDLGKLFTMLLEGKIEPRIGDIIDLEDINSYHQKLRAGGLTAKIVCKPS